MRNGVLWKQARTLDWRAAFLCTSACVPLVLTVNSQCTVQKHVTETSMNSLSWQRRQCLQVLCRS